MLPPSSDFGKTSRRGGRGTSPSEFYPLKATVVFLLVALFSPLTAQAHQLSNTYLTLEVTNGQITGHWEIALADLLQGQGEAAFNAAMTNIEALDVRKEMEKAEAFSKLNISVDGSPVKLKPVDYSTVMFPDGPYAATSFEGSMPIEPRRLEIAYNWFSNADPPPNGLMKLVIGEKTVSAVFDPLHAKQTFVLREVSAIETFFQFVRLGVEHILDWRSYDHILFLLALLFPSVLRWQNGKWEISASFRASFINVLKVVTAFTLAHSVTLSLAALKIVQLNSRFVETTIAVSIMFAALNNLFAVMPDLNWLIAFCFGFVHGFGFASVLGGLGLERGNLAVPLVGFNVGVELGQLVIVSIFLPLAFRLRPTRFYRVGVLRFGSLAVVALAGIWAWERIFDRKLLPF